MSTSRALDATARLANMSFVPLLLSAVYPAVFLLSLNWYALKTEEIFFVLLTSVVAAVTAYLFIRFAVWSLFECFHPLRGPSKYAEWKSAATVLLIALACSVIFFFLMYGTLQRLLITGTFLLLSFLALTALTMGLAINRRLGYWTILLGIMTLTSLVTWGHSIVAAAIEAADQRRSMAMSFHGLKFKNRPNIYLIVYDAYGNRRLYREVYGVDNTAAYQALAERNFKVLDTYSNYWNTWDTMLAVFLADHHYYNLAVGYDLRIGRSIMNGKISNPVYSVLKDNGYKLQHIESSAYLVKDQGNLDYLYSGNEPVYGGLRLFNNPLLDLLPSEKPKTREGYTISMTEVLLQRLQETAKESTPVFTYIHFPLPAHASSTRSWRELQDYEQDYREIHPTGQCAYAAGDRQDIGDRS